MHETVNLLFRCAQGGPTPLPAVAVPPATSPERASCSTSRFSIDTRPDHDARMRFSMRAKSAAVSGSGSSPASGPRIVTHSAYAPQNVLAGVEGRYSANHGACRKSDNAAANKRDDRHQLRVIVGQVRPPVPASSSSRRSGSRFMIARTCSFVWPLWT